MRVYFTGAHSSGKSTLARYVSEKYKLPIITEIARMVLSERELAIDSLRADIDLVDDYQSDVFFRQIEEEKKYEYFVADRSLIDCLAYTLQHSRVGGLDCLTGRNEFEMYLETIKRQDTIVFLVRPSTATLGSDGVREKIDWDGIISIDSAVKMLLKLYNIRYFQINTSNMQERVDLVDAVLTLVK